MQSSILSNVQLSKVNATLPQVGDDGYSSDTELIHNSELLDEALDIDLNKPITLKRSNWYPDLEKSPEFQRFCQYHDDINTNYLNNMVFSLVHNWVDTRQDELGRMDLNPDNACDTYEKIIESKIQKLLLKRERIQNRHLRTKMNITVKKHVIPLPTRRFKRQQRLNKMLEEARDK